MRTSRCLSSCTPIILAVLVVLLVPACSDSPDLTASGPGQEADLIAHAQLTDLADMPPDLSGTVASNVIPRQGNNVVYLGSCPTTYPASAVDVKFPYAYVTSYVGTPHGALDIIDISDPDNPTVVGSYDCITDDCLRLPVDVHVIGQEAWVADVCATQGFPSRLYKFDVSSPSAPSSFTVSSADVYWAI